MKPYEDLTGQKFNRLIAIKPMGHDKKKNKLWLCKCDCGKEVIVRACCLKRGFNKSCGCLRAEGNNQRKHGLSRSRLWRIHSQMKVRCYDKNSEAYKNYGARGITICDLWLGEDGLKNFAEWSYKNGYSDKLTIDRKDNNKGYTPDNCRWVERTIQGRNKRSNHNITFNGETKTLVEWSEITGIGYGTLKSRIKAGWDVEEAFTREVRANGKV